MTTTYLKTAALSLVLAMPAAAAYAGPLDSMREEGWSKSENRAPYDYRLEHRNYGSSYSLGYDRGYYEPYYDGLYAYGYDDPYDYRFGGPGFGFYVR